MRRTLVAAGGAAFGWWLGILAGGTVGGMVTFLSSPFAGRIVGGALAAVLSGAIAARANPETRGKRLRLLGATVVVTVLAALTLVDVRSVPWLVGAAFGAALALAEATALGAIRRDLALRIGTYATAWGLGFLVLSLDGVLGKAGVLGPGLAVLLHAAALARPRRSSALPA